MNQEQESNAAISEQALSKIRIVAAEEFYGEAARAVGGENVEVISVLKGSNIDPHHFEPTPDISRQIHEANVIIYNGLGYDDWMENLIGASDKSKEVIVVGKDVAEKQEGDNEHVWYDPATMPKLVSVLADLFSRMDPANEDSYRQGAREYLESLAPLNELVARLKQAEPVTVAVSEPVFDYMLNALNYTVNNEMFAKAIEEETDPSPADLARLTDDIKNRRIRFFVHNVQTESPIVQNMVNLAKAHQIPVIEVSETAPQGKSYIEWMTEQLGQMDRLAAP